MYKVIVFLLTYSIYTFSFAQEAKELNKAPKATKQESKEVEKINWMGFEEAVELNKQEPKKFLIDVYTSWCGWCKKMDRTTFTQPEVVAYVSKHYHAVKLNAERKDTVRLDDRMFVNEKPDGRRHPHQLAISLMQGKMSYPTIVYLDEAGNMLQPIPGFQSAENILPILHYFGEDAYKSQEWPEFQKSYKKAQDSDTP
ncbi:MAG: thioredoxin family protein [Vicingaceae bacterium]